MIKKFGGHHHFVSIKSESSTERSSQKKGALKNQPNNTETPDFGNPIEYHEEVLSSQPTIPPNILAFLPLTGGCSESLGAFSFFF